jgi:hypothetical protein
MLNNCTANINSIMYGMTTTEYEFANLLHNKLITREEDPRCRSL